MLKVKKGKDNFHHPATRYEFDLQSDQGKTNEYSGTSRLSAKTLTGRDLEMDELNQALRDSLDGNGHVVMLVGEAGIGKTHVAEEIAAAAGRDGAMVLHGICSDKPGAFLCWPWIQAMRPYILQSDSETLALEMGLGVADIASIVPELKEKMPDIEPAPEVDPDQGRFRLLDSITNFLRAIAAKQPLVIVLDDLQYADKSSSLLLQFMASEIGRHPILLVGCYRDRDILAKQPLREVVGDLYRDRSFRQINLQNLSQDEVAKVVEIQADSDVPQWVVEAIYKLTDGNPFFVQEVAHMLAQQSKLTPDDHERDDWDIGVPGSVREIILSRVNSLEPDCRDVLEIASIIGKEFSFLALNKLFDALGAEALLDALEEARNANLIDEVSDRPGYYQFTHAIFQRTILEGNSSTRRALMHSQIANALEELYTAKADVSVGELVYHFEQAKSVLGVDKFVQYSITAGEQALATYATEDALTHFQNAFEARERHPMDDEISSILYGLGRAQASSGQLFNAWTSFKRAFEYYIENHNLQMATNIAEYPMVIVPGDNERVQLISTVLDKVPKDSLEWARLQAMYGRVYYVATGDYDKARQSLAQALVIAERERNTSLETRIKAYMGTVEIDHMHWNEGLNQSQQTVASAMHVNDLKVEVRARYDSTRAMFANGNLEMARSFAGETQAQAEKLRDSFWLASAYWVNSNLSKLEGKWDTARALTSKGLSIHPNDSRLLGTSALIEYELDDQERAKSYRDELFRTMSEATADPVWENTIPALVVPLAAYIQDNEDLIDYGKNAVQAAADKVLNSSYATPELSLWATTGLALTAAIKGDKDIAKRCERALEDARQNSTQLIAGVIHIDRVLAMIARTLGQLEKAEAYIESAEKFYEDDGCLPELAWAYYDHASLVAVDGKAQVQRRVSELLNKSSKLVDELGMVSLANRITELKAEISRNPVSRPYNLTKRELEALGLIAQGKSNIDMSVTMGIALDTAIRHTSNVLMKLMCENRTQAALRAVQEGIVPYIPPEGYRD